MAAYAAYRHVELDNIGCGKRRVLKPPGGGTSDLFGADSQDFSRKQLGGHHVAAGGPSPVSSTEHPSSPVNFKAGMNSYDRLFGAPQPNISKNNYRNPLQSQISFGNNNIEEEVKVVKEVDNGNTDIERKEEPITTPDGNPVTGEGYELPKNGQPAAIIPNLVNGDVSTPTTPITPPLKNRVPPGGYSSGLW